MESEEVQPGIVFDYNAAGQVVGIEMLGLSHRIPSEQLRYVQVETAA